MGREDIEEPTVVEYVVALDTGVLFISFGYQNALKYKIRLL